jgi:hypothetical protein
MKRIEQAEFIHDLIERVRTELYAKIPLLPEEWDGHELRQWIAERFQGASYLKDKRYRARYRAFRRVIASTTL